MSKIPVQPINFDIARRAADETVIERRVPVPVIATAPSPKLQSEEGRGEVPRVETAPTPPVRTTVSKLTLQVPAYVMDAIHARCLQSKPRATARYIVLQALRASGFDIRPEDLVIDRRVSRPE